MAGGKYSITAGSNAVLIFSFLGYEKLEIPVSNRTIIDAKLVKEVVSLDEVVVSALGIKKQARGLGYSSTNVNTEQLSVNRTSNPINTLQGRVAGLNVSSLGTGLGGSSKIRIRCKSSINGQNNPLIVINGVSVDNTNFNTDASGVKGVGITADG